MQVGDTVYLHTEQKGDAAREVKVLKVGRTLATLEYGPPEGERLCTHCFADAPAEWTNGELRETREAREARAAAKAERDAKAALKNLTPDQRFRDAMRDTVTTVAGCKEALRDEVRYRDYYGHGEHSFHPASVVAAKRAAEVLLEREAAVPGSGADRAAIDKIVANAVKQNRKDGARI